MSGSPNPIEIAGDSRYNGNCYDVRRAKGKMAQKDRLESIRSIVKAERRVVVSELSKQFDVTEETIRRDLEKLEGEGLVTRTYGGAVLMHPVNADVRISYMRRTQINVEEKQAIARIAVRQLPQHGAAIGADSSSTVREAIRLLSDREDLLLMTYSASILRELEDARVKVMSTGGFLNKKSFSFQGVIARNTIKDYHMDVALISCKGLQLGSGAFDSDEDEAELKRLMIQGSQKVFLLVDHTKFGKLAFTKVFDLDQVDVVITDRQPGAEWVEWFAANNIQLLY